MITSYGPRHARGARREQVLPDALVINEAGPPNPTATISQLAILGHSASSTVTSPATVGALPWFPINTGTLKTPGLAWRTHLHSEIAGLGSNWASSPLLANLRSHVSWERPRWATANGRSQLVLQRVQPATRSIGIEVNVACSNTVQHDVPCAWP
jgi:hypothetical protein